MKKRLHFLSDQSGFYLPYTLCITIIILLTVTTYIKLYRQDIEVTHQHLEQLTIETLRQVAFQKFKEDYPTIDTDQVLTHYTFPTGTVKVRYESSEEPLYNLQIDVLTIDQSANSSYKRINPINDAEDMSSF